MFLSLPIKVAYFRIACGVATLVIAALAGCSARASNTALPNGSTIAGQQGSPRIAQATNTQTNPDIIAINAGGAATDTFIADTDDVGGMTYAVTSAINTTAVNAAPATVYQTQRYGNMTYTIPGLTAGATYTVRLHFAETYFGVAGRSGPAQRLFNVAINGISVLLNFDVFSAAGGANIALVRDIAATANASGHIVISFTAGSANNAMISGIEVFAASVAPSISINVGGQATGVFVADVDGQGGTISTSQDTFDLSAANAAPAAVYQTQRYGPMTYTIGALTPGAAYTVRLHFIEEYWGVDGRSGGVGSRRFNVAINGASILSNFDVFALAGGDKALIVDTPSTATAGGAITVALTNGAADNAMLSAIQVIPAVAAAGSTAAPIVGSEAARSSDAFVDAAGVNVHLSDTTTLYGQNFAAVKGLLQTAGIRHIRDGTSYGQANICAEDVALGAAGIHIDVIVSTPIANLAPWLTCIGTSAELLEDYNEYDASGDPNWASVLRTAEPLIGAAVPLLPQIAPALTSENSYVSLGLLPGVTYGNSHAYFAGRNPGTNGWGGTDAYGTYGSLAWNVAIAGAVSGTQTVDLTETGYSDQTDSYAVPPVTKARYTVRTYLNDWISGVNRTYLYELADEGSAPFAHYGLVDASGNPKPAFTAVESLLSHTSDPGSTFTASPLQYTFVPASATVRHTVLEKRNGTYEVIFWNEVAEWDPNANVAIATTPQTVTLTFAKVPSSMQQTTFADSGSVATTPLVSQSTMVLSAGAWPTIVDIVP